jgi:hypothetical protein
MDTARCYRGEPFSMPHCVASVERRGGLVESTEARWKSCSGFPLKSFEANRPDSGFPEESRSEPNSFKATIRRRLRKANLRHCPKVGTAVEISPCAPSIADGNRLSLQQPGGRIADEKLGVAAIDSRHFKALVAGLVADLEQVHAASSRDRSAANGRQRSLDRTRAGRRRPSRCRRRCGP